MRLSMSSLAPVNGLGSTGGVNKRRHVLDGVVVVDKDEDEIASSFTGASTDARACKSRFTIGVDAVSSSSSTSSSYSSSSSISSSYSSVLVTVRVTVSGCGLRQVHVPKSTLFIMNPLVELFIVQHEIDRVKSIDDVPFDGRLEFGRTESLRRTARKFRLTHADDFAA